MKLNKNTRLFVNSLEAREVMASNILGVAADYNALFFHSITSTYSDTEGKLAVGGNATLEGYSVGDKVSNVGAELVVGGNLSYINGQVDGGDVVYGGTLNSKWFGLNGGTATQAASPINFAQINSDLTAKSMELAAKPATGTVVNRFGGLYLTGTKTDINYFNLTAAQLGKTWGINISAPAGSTVIVNISGTTANFKFAGYSLSGGINASNVLLNFSQATTINLNGVGIEGSILAPKAHLNFDNGQIRGTVVACSMCGYGQFNWLESNVNTPVTTGTVCGQFFCDCNGNGIFDAGDMKATGYVTLRQWNAKGQAISSINIPTDAYGMYKLGNLPVGSYSLDAYKNDGTYIRSKQFSLVAGQHFAFDVAL
jgi:choice-of-anchor A domain-containing protein